MTDIKQRKLGGMVFTVAELHAIIEGLGMLARHERSLTSCSMNATTTRLGETAERLLRELPE